MGNRHRHRLRPDPTRTTRKIRRAPEARYSAAIRGSQFKLRKKAISKSVSGREKDTGTTSGWFSALAGIACQPVNALKSLFASVHTRDVNQGVDSSSESGANEYNSSSQSELDIGSTSPKDSTMSAKRRYRPSDLQRKRVDSSSKRQRRRSTKDLLRRLIDKISSDESSDADTSSIDARMRHHKFRPTDILGAVDNPSNRTSMISTKSNTKIMKSKFPTIAEISKDIGRTSTMGHSQILRRQDPKSRSETHISQSTNIRSRRKTVFGLQNSSGEEDSTEQSVSAILRAVDGIPIGRHSGFDMHNQRSTLVGKSSPKNDACIAGRAITRMTDAPLWPESIPSTKTAVIIESQAHSRHNNASENTSEEGFAPNAFDSSSSSGNEEVVQCDNTRIGSRVEDSRDNRGQNNDSHRSVGAAGGHNEYHIRVGMELTGGMRFDSPLGPSLSNDASKTSSSLETTANRSKLSHASVDHKSTVPHQTQGGYAPPVAEGDSGSRIHLSNSWSPLSHGRACNSASAPVPFDREDTDRGIIRRVTNPHSTTVSAHKNSLLFTGTVGDHLTRQESLDNAHNKFIDTLGKTNEATVTDVETPSQRTRIMKGVVGLPFPDQEIDAVDRSPGLNGGTTISTRAIFGNISSIPAIETQTRLQGLANFGCGASGTHSGTLDDRESSSTPLPKSIFSTDHVDKFDTGGSNITGGNRSGVFVNSDETSKKSTSICGDNADCNPKKTVSFDNTSSYRNSFGGILYNNMQITTGKSSGILSNTQNPTEKINGIFDNTQSIAEKSSTIFGNAQNASEKSSGIFGDPQRATENSSGRFGNNQEATDKTNGVFGNTQGNSDKTNGVFGNTQGPSDKTNGIFGNTQGTSDKSSGIFGNPQGTSDKSSGIFGNTQSTTDKSNSLFGNTPSTAETSSGILGTKQITAEKSNGIFGNTQSIFGNTQSTTEKSNSVFGNTPSAAGTSSGIFGTNQIAAETFGGVCGSNQSTAEKSNGVFGTTQSIFGKTQSTAEKSNSIFGNTPSAAETSSGIFSSNTSVLSPPGGQFGNASKFHSQGIIHTNTEQSTATSIFGSSLDNKNHTSIFANTTNTRNSIGKMFGETKLTTGGPGAMFTSQPMSNTSGIFSNIGTGNSSSGVFSTEFNVPGNTSGSNPFNSDAGKRRLLKLKRR